ncbi:MAG: hypothetical protein NTU41_14925, partial [Chloroflexi bacterium]|nr:hypothetical protein [Chloroflexota bacterium]
MYSKETVKLATIFVVLFLIGLCLANPIIVGVSLLPFFVLVLGLRIRLPERVQTVEASTRSLAWVGEV